MILGIGVDCEEIARFKEIISNKKFLDKVFTKKELDYCNSQSNPIPHLAVRFAGKEAVKKAFSSTNKDIFFNQIEILNNESGAPYVNIDNLNKKLNIFISLSHSNSNAIAFAVISEGDTK